MRLASISRHNEVRVFLVSSTAVLGGVWECLGCLGACRKDDVDVFGSPKVDSNKACLRRILSGGFDRLGLRGMTGEWTIKKR